MELFYSDKGKPLTSKKSKGGEEDGWQEKTYGNEQVLSMAPQGLLTSGDDLRI
jgi:hypothetical protein